MENKLNELKYWLALGRNSRFTGCNFRELISQNRPFSELTALSSSKLANLGISKRTITLMTESLKTFDPDKVLEELRRYKVSIMTINNPHYPRALKEIYDPPAILYYKGGIDFQEVAIGIVGSRKPTDYGVAVTEELSCQLAKTGFAIISGLALGIDSIAHHSALKANGKTIAVLGCGLDQVYPSTHQRLAREIVESAGGLVSEYPIGTPPMKQNFPARNRIISGMASGLLVTEAAAKSGSLITAYAALEQNREVFAVPGSIYNLNSQGTNRLIKAGAHPVTCQEDIIEELGIELPEEMNKIREIVADNPKEATIIKILRNEPKHIDQIIKEALMDSQIISSTLSIMEITGKVSVTKGLVYRLKN